MRALLSRTPEWMSEATRRATAEALRGVGSDSLATALWAHDTSCLRKAHVLALCALWRYRCDAWVPKRGAPQRARSQAPAQLQLQAQAQAQLQAAPAHPRLFGRGAGGGGALAPSPQQLVGIAPPLVAPPGSAAVLALRRTLQGCVRDYMHATARDSVVFAIGAREPLAPVTTWSAAMYGCILSAVREMANTVAADAATLSVRAVALSMEEHEPPPWWMTDDRETLVRTDAHLFYVQSLLVAHGRGHRAVYKADAPPLSAVDTAIMESWAGSIGQLDVLTCTALSALATSRMTRCSHEHMETAAEVAAALSCALAHMACVFEARRSWCVARTQPALAATAAADAVAAQPDGAALGQFWPTVMDTLTNSPVDAAIIIKPRLAAMVEDSVRNVCKVLAIKE